MKNWGVEEVGGSDEEEGAGANEGGVGLVLGLVVVLGGWEEEPGVGGRVKGKGLVVL